MGVDNIGYLWNRNMKIKLRTQIFINKLYLIYFKMKLKKRKGVTLARKSRITSDDVFEGNNYIGGGTSIFNCNVGYGTYILNDCWFNCARIGRYCSIASDVRMISAKGHPKSYVSTSPVFHKREAFINTYVEEDCYEVYEKCGIDPRYNAIIGNDVWIGKRALLMGAITIGDGAILGAGAIVTKNVPPYAIVAGVPAKVIGYRFNEEQIEKLLNIKWWNKPEAWIKGHADQFTDIDHFINDVERDRMEK